jgi:hypothetical protein
MVSDEGKSSPTETNLLLPSLKPSEPAANGPEAAGRSRLPDLRRGRADQRAPLVLEAPVNTSLIFSPQSYGEIWAYCPLNPKARMPQLTESPPRAEGLDLKPLRWNCRGSSLKHIR